MSFNKKIKSIIILLSCINLVSCTTIENQYSVSRITNFQNEANEDTFAIGYGSDKIIPSRIEELIVSNVGAESYFIAPVNRFESDYVKYHNPYKQLPMASLTKIMTALIVLKYETNLDKLYYVSGDAVYLEREASKADLVSGDTISVRDLLYALLIPSGNDAANVIAENFDGGVDNFVILMNNEAEKLGALSTHFANPHGLDSEYHYSTAYDMYLIMAEVCKYPLFREIASMNSYTTKILQSDETYREATWNSTNYFITKEMMIANNIELIAGKTGNTSNAGNCLILLSKNKTSNIEYISVVLNATNKRNVYYNSNSLMGGEK